MNKPFIELRNIERSFEGGKVRALAGITASVERSETVAIIGPSGSGKTTLLNIIATIDFLTAGEFLFNGEKILPTTNVDVIRSKEIGIIFQLHNLIPTLTLKENVVVPMMPLRRSKKEAYTLAQKLLEKVGLKNRCDALPGVVSAGERQRTAIARALANEPDLILADEPTGSLDSANGQMIMNLLLETARATAKTLIVVTHNPEVSKQLDRVLLLENGKLA